MTDRIRTITVALDRDIRDDDVQPILDAIGMIKCVAHVTPNVVDYGDYAARSSLAHNVQRKMYEAIDAIFKDLKLD